MSPGSNWPPANTITDSSHNVINDRPTRVPMKRTTRIALPRGPRATEAETVVDIDIPCSQRRAQSGRERRAIEIQLRDRREAHAVQLLARGDQLVVEEREDHG